MAATRSARQRKAAAEAGPLGKVRIDLAADDSFLYKVACTTCVTKSGSPWSSYRTGQDNGYLAAMDRWILHLAEKHPGEEAPCLAYLPAAQERLQARRDSSV